MMKIVVRTASTLLLLGIAAPVMAQTDDPARDPTIVVTGKQPLTEEQTLEVVRRSARTVDGQLARFYAPVCPRVTGFDTPYERIVAERIKAIARAVGARAGGEGCVTNFQVVIVDDGREFVDLLWREHPEAFAGLTRREVRRLASEEGTARAWTVTILTNSGGATASNPSPSAGGGTVKGQGGASITFDGSANVMRTYDASNINPSVQQSMGTSWVVIETGATFGKSLTQIADYAAMRGLAMVRPAELAGSTDTILALFEPASESAPPELTEFDRAYLKGLYRAQGRRWARQQVRQMADVISRESEQDTP
jgi:hypothetical protein